MCLFDLPFETKQEQKEYRIFRKHLLENGFIMLQYSIYYRSLPNRSALKKYEAILKRKVPQGGNVRLLYVSETQFKICCYWLVVEVVKKKWLVFADWW